MKFLDTVEVINDKKEYIDNEVYFIDRLPEYRKVFCDILGIAPHILKGSLREYLDIVQKIHQKYLL